MREYLWFWAAKGLVEIGIALGILMLIGLVVLAVSIPMLIRQSRCSHSKVTETRSCDAICVDCGKNLGFIGTWRKAVATNQRGGDE